MAGVLRWPGFLCPFVGIWCVAKLKFPFLVALEVDGCNLREKQLNIHAEDFVKRTLLAAMPR